MPTTPNPALDALAAAVAAAASPDAIRALVAASPLPQDAVWTAVATSARMWDADLFRQVATRWMSAHALQLRAEPLPAAALEAAVRAALGAVEAADAVRPIAPMADSAPDHAAGPDAASRAPFVVLSNLLWIASVTGTRVDPALCFAVQDRMVALSEARRDEGEGPRVQRHAIETILADPECAPAHLARVAGLPRMEGEAADHVRALMAHPRADAGVWRAIVAVEGRADALVVVADAPAARRDPLVRDALERRAAGELGAGQLLAIDEALVDQPPNARRHDRLFAQLALDLEGPAFVDAFRTLAARAPAEAIYLLSEATDAQRQLVPRAQILPLVQRATDREVRRRAFQLVHGLGR